MKQEKIPVRMSKRILDLGICAIFLLFGSPVLIALLALILLNYLLIPADRGSVLYRERRISHGKAFYLLKFRTLKRSKLFDPSTGQKLGMIKKLESDEENLTLSGKYLIKCYMDELPQILNVLKGEMSFIGPRPFDCKSHHGLVKEGIVAMELIPCGITGIGQSMKGNPERSLSLEEKYLQAYRSASPLELFKLDLKIVCDSVRVVVQAKGI